MDLPQDIGGVGVASIARVVTLHDKLATYEESKKQLDQAAAAGEVIKGSAIEVGEKVEIYSDSVKGWVDGVVVELVENEARVRYNVGDRQREKLVAAVSSELRRKISQTTVETADVEVGGKTGKGKKKMNAVALKRAEAALMRVPSARSLHACKELIAWTYFIVSDQIELPSGTINSRRLCRFMGLFITHRLILA